MEWKSGSYGSTSGDPRSEAGAYRISRKSDGSEYELHHETLTGYGDNAKRTSKSLGTFQSEESAKIAASNHSGLKNAKLGGDDSGLHVPGGANRSRSLAEARAKLDERMKAAGVDVPNREAVMTFHKEGKVGDRVDFTRDGKKLTGTVVDLDRAGTPGRTAVIKTDDGKRYTVGTASVRASSEPKPIEDMGDKELQSHRDDLAERIRLGDHSSAKPLSRADLNKLEGRLALVDLEIRRRRKIRP